jgi:hypothetical protein
MRRLGSYEGITVLSFGKRDLERKIVFDTTNPRDTS